MIENYIVEYPNFYVPKEDLFNYQDGHKEYKENVHFKTQHNLDTASECKFFDLVTKDCKSANILLDLVKGDNYKFTKVLAGGVMPPHTDPLRTGVLMIPLTEEPSPIVFYENNRKIFSHKYVCPTLINAKIKHGVPEVKKDRIFLQINFVQSWDNLKKMRLN